MKAALIALALLTSLPAAASTVVIDQNLAVMQVQFPDLYTELMYDEANGYLHTAYYDWIKFYESYPEDTLFIEMNSASTTPFEVAFYVDYGATINVPEPATWALLLFGLAFFAIKGIWPNDARR